MFPSDHTRFSFSTPAVTLHTRLSITDNSHWTKVTVFPDSFRVRGVTFAKGDPVVVTSRVTGEEFHGEITVVKPKAVGCFLAVVTYMCFFAALAFDGLIRSGVVFGNLQLYPSSSLDITPSNV